MGGWLEPWGGIIGRDRERAVVREFLGAIPTGLVALAIDGDAGIGKSTIWADGLAAARCRGWRVLACRPAAAEARMSFAGLSDLIEPVIDELLPQLAAPQRQALEAALARGELAHLPHDERGVSIGFLSMIRHLCKRGPVLLAVDDLQWLDRPTARVLQFAIRRSSAEPVGLIVSARADHHRHAVVGLSSCVSEERRMRLRLGPMTLAELHRVLGSRGEERISRRLLLQIHRLSAGNPFFALELARAVAAHDLEVTPGEPLPLPTTLGQLVAGRLARLPARTRAVLLVASALAQPAVSLVQQFDPDSSALERLTEAERRGLIRVDHDRIRFAHPLLASTLYGAAPALERQRVHRRLAEIVTDPEQQARHLALAAGSPDERVAAALEAAAGIADARGAPDTAAELCELARDLTPPEDPAAVLRRSRLAAEHSFSAGDGERAQALAAPVIAGCSSGPELARALHLVAKLRYYGDSFPEAARLLRRALEHAGDDPALRAPIELDTAYVIYTFDGFPAAAGHARAAVRHARKLSESGLLAEALAVVVMAEFLSGRGLDKAKLERALALEDRARRVPVNLRPSLIAGLILAWIGESQAACARFEQLRAWLMERGEEGQLPMISGSGLVLAHCWSGDLPAAARAAREGLEVALQLGTAASRGLALSGMALANAYLGTAADARRQATESVELLRSVGWHLATVFPLTALGLVHLSLDQPADADRILRPLVALLGEAGLGEPSSVPFVTDEIEALVAIGELVLAERLLDTFEAQARTLDRAVSLATAARCRALLLAARGEPDAALVAVAGALAQHDRAPRPIELARTLLVRGRLQRRANQRRAAGETLECALATFEKLGAAQWAARTRGELSRLGLRRQAGDELTPTEEQVAQHAASGMTNREVARAMFISPKTVEANLGRAYRKLSVSSRAELGWRMAERERAAAAESERVAAVEE